jgi:uncharacterized protein YjbI with pentapeptide repeats
MASLFLSSKYNNLTFFHSFFINQDLEGARLDGANLLGAIR